MNDNPGPRARFTPPFTFTDFLVASGIALVAYALLTAALVLTGPR